MKIPQDADILFGEIRPEGTNVTDADKLAQKKEYLARKRAEKKAMGLATGEKLPRDEVPRNKLKSIVNRVTEYGALFNKLNEERLAKGLPPLKTAMEVLIDAMQSDEIDIKDKARIADKLAPFESSRAPVISIEHVQNITKEEDISAEDAMDEFLDSLRKV
jgi:hypothetical protein